MFSEEDSKKLRENVESLLKEIKDNVERKEQSPFIDGVTEALSHLHAIEWKDEEAGRKYKNAIVDSEAIRLGLVLLAGQLETGLGSDALVTVQTVEESMGHVLALLAEIRTGLSIVLSKPKIEKLH